MFEQFSIQLITALVEVTVDGRSLTGEQVGRYRSGAVLETFLGNANIELNLASSSRNPATRNALVHANKTEPDRVKQVIEQVADPREYGDDVELHSRAIAHLNTCLAHDRLEIRQIGHSWKLVSSAGQAPVTEQLDERLRSIDYDSVDASFRKALEQAEADPSNATKEACSIVESVCKCILDEVGSAYPKRQDIQGLVKEVSKVLDLSPARPDIDADVRQILGGLSTVVNGIGALRTHEGAHGKGKNVARIDGRIARLAIHAASTIALFYIESWQRRKSG